MRIIILLLCLVPLTSLSQRLSLWDIPSGGYSGITALGDNRYAIVNDKQPEAGFSIWHIQLADDGSVANISNEGVFADLSLKNRDTEDVAYCPWRNTIFCCGEADQRIVEHQVSGQLTGHELAIPSDFGVAKITANRGFEALCIDANRQCFWTVTESALRRDSTGHLRLLCFDKNLRFSHEVPYTLETQQAKNAGRIHVHGVSAMTALPDGQLFILEREACIASNYVGSHCWCQLYLFNPITQEKRLITQLHTKFTLTNTRFANYEGMCLGPTLPDGRQTLLLISDAEGGYGRAFWHLRDRIKVILLP